MTETAPLNDIQFLVVRSEDGRMSIWPAIKPVPWGWAAEGFRGNRDACLAHIEETWTDLRPVAR